MGAKIAAFRHHMEETVGIESSDHLMALLAVGAGMVVIGAAVLVHGVVAMLGDLFAGRY